jgi:beta-amylase
LSIYEMLSLLLATCSAKTKFFVMAPLDVLDNNQNIKNQATLERWLKKLQEASVDGIMVDVWWGLVEKRAKTYTFTGYEKLFKLFDQYKLKIIPVLSFHQCGGNVGDTCKIPIPQFVLNCKPFWKDAEGHYNSEYISFSYDNVQLNGRTPIEMYSDFMRAFKNTFSSQISSDLIVEIEVGLGPAGELRYPSYQLAYWTYPGCGEFQSFDDKFVAKLKNDAAAAGKSSFGRNPTLAETGNYNTQPGQSSFWRDDSGNGWRSEYGQWFIKWYSQQLINHGDAVLKAARSIFGKTSLSGKIAGIHWWYDTTSHCAETTAGFNNFPFYDGYRDILRMFKKYDVDLCFTCLEMTKGVYSSNPPALVNQLLNDAKWAGIKFEGENALPMYDMASYDRVVAWVKNGLSCFTYLRLCADLIDNANNYNTFKTFVAKVHNA